MHFESHLAEWWVLSKFNFQHWFSDSLATGKEFYKLGANNEKALDLHCLKLCWSHQRKARLFIYIEITIWFFVSHLLVKTTVQTLFSEYYNWYKNMQILRWSIHISVHGITFSDWVEVFYWDHRWWKYITTWKRMFNTPVIKLKPRENLSNMYMYFKFTCMKKMSDKVTTDSNCNIRSTN